MLNRSSPLRFPAALTAAALVALSAMTSAALAQVNVTLNTRLQVLSFDPSSAPVYVMFMDLNGFGFINDSNPDNFLRLVAGNNSFTAEAYPGRFSGGSSSFGFGTIPGLADAISNAGTWTLTIYDADAEVTHEYTLDMSCPSIPEEYLRVINIDAEPNVPIDYFPTFNFSVDPTSNPLAEYENAFAGMFGNNNNVFSPSISVSDNSWSPDGPLNDDVYLLDIQFYNFNPDQSLVSVSYPVPDFGAPELSSFSHSVSAAAESQVAGLLVGEPFEGIIVDVVFDAGVVNFSTDLPTYIMPLSVEATGFSDPSHPDNYVKVASESEYFQGDAYPNQGIGGGGSVGFYSLSELNDFINSFSEPWIITITDGATATSYEYEFTVDSASLPEDLLRPTTVDVSPGDTIPTNPTFGIFIDPPFDPNYEYQQAFALLIGDSFYGSPSYSPNEPSWTPDGPIDVGTYTLIVRQDQFADNSLLNVSTPLPRDPGNPDLTLNYTIRGFSYAQVENLQVADAYCPADFNQDGGIDGADVEEFFNAFTAGDQSADTNQDGGIDGSDVETFFVAWEAGGC